MNKYELVFESLQKSLSNGEITLEEAEVLNEYAYDKYVEEATRLSKEIDKLHRSTLKYPSGDSYERMRDIAAGHERYRISDENKIRNDGFGRYGYLDTDSLGKGRDTAKELAKRDGSVSSEFKNYFIKRGEEDKSRQKKVFKTEPANSAYYDAKKKVSDKRNEFHSSNLKAGKEKIREVNSQKTYNPVKALQNKKKREDIAKTYIDNTKKIDKNANDKLKEILKHRK